jgi:hypothetical protein
VSALLLGFGGFTVPGTAQSDLAVAGNFERFDGLNVPATNPATSNPDKATPTGEAKTPHAYSPRPGMQDAPEEQVYTPGPLRGLTNTLGGQPLPVNDWKFRGDRQYTRGRTHSIQHRMGDGQANQGAAQTVALSEITGNPPIPGDLSGIIAGVA